MLPRHDQPQPDDGKDSADSDDAALFHAAIGPVRRLPQTPPPPAKPRPKASAQMAERDDAAARDEFLRAMRAPLLAGDTLSYRRDEVPPRVLSRLARGHYAAQDELDLHHVDSVQAEAMLRQFLKEATASRLGCVRVIHGKGLRAADGVPVLKNLVDRLLRQRRDVLAFHSTPAAAGGTGAVLVLLAGR